MFELFVNYRADVQYIASLLLGLAMFRLGGAPERLIAGVFIGLFIIPNLLIEWFAGEVLFFVQGGSFYAGIDIAAAVLFIAIALNANRNYPLWIAGFQLVATSAHVVRYIIDAVTPLAHAVMVIGPSYFQLFLMAIGLVRHIQRTKKFGEYRDWRIPIRWPKRFGKLRAGT